MKLKAVVSDEVKKISPDFVDVLNKLRPIVLRNVLVPHLHVGNFGPAEFYVQHCDFADGETHDLFCEVRLTGVSLNDDRSVNDFRRALNELENIYRELIEAHFSAGILVQFYVSIMLDAHLPGTFSSIIENEPRNVQGRLQKV